MFRRRSVLELNAHLGLSFVERLSGFEDDGDSGPAGVVDEDSYGGEGGAVGIFIGDGFVVGVAFVLAEEDIGEGYGLHGLEDANFFVADFFAGFRTVELKDGCGWENDGC